MDLAITIFWVGVGIGAVLVGIGVMMIAVAVRPVARDARALANDARRLTRLAESELTVLMGRTREIAQETEQLSSDLAHEVDVLRAKTDALEERVTEPVAVGREPIGSVQSPHAREDDQIA